MNPAALVHLIAGCVGIGVSIPLIRGRVKMNPWYGIRIPAAFESEERWREINRHGGVLLARWGAVVALFGACGLLLRREWWVLYNLVALAPIIGGLLLVIVLIYRHARRTGK